MNYNFEKFSVLEIYEFRHSNNTIIAIIICNNPSNTAETTDPTDYIGLFR